ncbi:MAG: YraN family protein [Thermodesulfovibrio sp.]|nr:YraN family protein [Thermodesulfovibrio sp.]MDW7998224.1 YraN family protein [Thermodesulfovibrio sp.]
MATVDLGKEGEKLAIDYLLAKGYKILERNFRTVFGEIDIIARDKNYIVIIEVKRRLSERFGKAELSVNYKKQERIKKSALYYVSRLEKEYPVRFDVIAINGKEIEHIENAFY